MIGRWIRCALACLLAACGSAPDVDASSACAPACRAGFVCAGGTCVSCCNPECGASQRCVCEGSDCGLECSGDWECAAGRTDGGPPDAGSSDAGSRDAESLDAGAQDAGSMDGGGCECSGHGTCAGAVCSCALGYSGDRCDRCAEGYAGYPSCTILPGCTDECPSEGALGCLDGDTEHFCADHDADGCLEWGGARLCAGACIGDACSDCGRDGVGSIGGPCCGGGCCPGGAACDATDICRCPDSDGDASTDAQCGGGDCDDGVAGVRPGASELCNGIDDDCDARVDENLARACMTSCGSPGTETCQAGAWQGCRNAACGGSSETCNGLDDDGDGSIDEVFIAPLGATMSCIADCGAAGTRTGRAIAGGSLCAFGACTPYGEAEGSNCSNTIDDECDGLVDCDDPDCASARACTVRCE